MKKTNPVGVWAMHAFGKTRKRAALKNVPHGITRDHLIAMAHPTCPVLGIPMDYACAAKVKNDHSPTVDRLIPQNGYVADNITVISERANRGKSDATLEELKALRDWIKSF
jgi:hypothetical protein